MATSASADLAPNLLFQQTRSVYSFRTTHQPQGGKSASSENISQVHTRRSRLGGYLTPQECGAKVGLSGYQSRTSVQSGMGENRLFGLPKADVRAAVGNGEKLNFRLAKAGHPGDRRM